jgi:phosphatidylglycerol lysyltransferase
MKMINDKTYTIRKYVENVAIAIMMLSGIANVILSMLYTPALFRKFMMYYSNIVHPNIDLYWLLRRIIGIILIFVSYHLYKRMRTAWIITIITLSVSVTLQITRFHNTISLMVFGQLSIILILLLFQNDFRRKSDMTSIKKAVFLSIASVLLVLVTSSIGFLTIKDNYKGLRGFTDSFIHSIQLLFFMDTSAVATTRLGAIYADMTVTFNWCFILVALFFVLKPIIYNPIITRRDKERVFQMVSQYGQNPMSYLALENDKKYFFGKACDGVIAFAVVGDTAVVCGDIICSDDDAVIFITEFLGFCRENHYGILFLNITDHFLDLYHKMGFQSTKYGEDACFLLEQYNLAGGKAAKVRAAINHANKEGITVSEYKPSEHRDMAIELEIKKVSNEWLKAKKIGELSFMLGGIGLEEPYDRRFFVARDANGEMQGFVVFVPYDDKKAYLADVTRRRNNAPQGILEKLIYEGFMTFKEEGATWGSMGLVPLANVREDSVRAKFTTKLFEYIYENLNDIYGFKPLYHAKAKYGPTHWQSRYLAYYPKRFTPQLAYAIVKVQNPKGIHDYIWLMMKKFKIPKKNNE